ncbi:MULTISPECIES: IclR family transcriptional regulator [Microbacterium]|uniref:IclR family transcriptional regulator n=1 Tax=Microbacterium TaxID=33882 RepID=UPI000C2C50D2|nr:MULTISPECIES: IclR family transcriptional regulator [Microbacterium]
MPREGRSKPGGEKLLDDDRSLTAPQKVFAVLDALYRTRRPMSLSAIGRSTSLPLTTVHRILGELVDWGGLERDENGVYRIGLHLWELGSLAPRSTGLVDAALPFLEDLYEATHGNVRLGVREGTEAIFVSHLSGHGSVPLRTRAATRLPMRTTGAGLVLLAHAPADVFNDVVEKSLPRFTPFTIVDVGSLRRILADVRRDGYAICDRQMTSEAVSVAAPIRSTSGDVIAAVSVAVRGEGTPAVREHIPAVLMAARGISRALADQPPAWLQASAASA